MWDTTKKIIVKEWHRSGGTKEKPSIKVEGYPRIFKNDLYFEVEKNVFDQNFRKTSGKKQVNLKKIETNIVIKRMF